ncbi:MAG TPA: PhzF family phenazine biosynthesis protein [Haliscomenobacter sp.]|uniref:PhzF family phenazine biosynthesis protein n=1 Tax=Haliscomenobacter sp. TaxID=2717303 RepID=UPI002BCE8DCB|nr:PhzF family phenazine biosynthesis protein [Haliscomenobacter sp.]HOY16617.1 PhzF family phenazine biosynthesis protein [Haliscomenobacter sp.]
MELSIYQVDAFANAVFQGNPAAVVPLNAWLPDEVLQNIATENNLSETAYFVPEGEGYHLRWFTPAMEVRLCGHATLASAHVLFAHLGYNKESISFNTLGGNLLVRKIADQYVMDFPTDEPQPFHVLRNLEETLGVQILEMAKGTDDYLAMIESEEMLMALRPNFRRLSELKTRGLIVTAPGTSTDIATRCFFPSFGIDEDPVTGSAHTLLTPFWAKKLGKTSISAIQGGARKGQLHCELKGDRVELMGKAQTYLIGKIWV